MVVDDGGGTIVVGGLVCVVVEGDGAGVVEGAGLVVVGGPVDVDVGAGAGAPAVVGVVSGHGLRGRDLAALIRRRHPRCATEVRQHGVPDARAPVIEVVRGRDLADVARSSTPMRSVVPV